jgi:hypothetical protein
VAPKVTDLPHDETLNNIPFCKGCGKACTDLGVAIPCDECGTFWHCDCLNPPRVKAPPKPEAGKTNNFSRPYFRCPLHVANHLDVVGDPRVPDPVHKDDRTSSRDYIRVHRRRTPRDPRMVSPGIIRGNRNNGIIDVDLDSDEDEVAQEDGVRYKLSARQVFKDFVAKAKL